MKGLSREEISIAEFYTELLIGRFNNKINFKEYALCYSGGKDSHFLYFFIKNILRTSPKVWQNAEDILIASANTQREFPEIKNRMFSNADIIVYPELKMDEIKEKFGMPCFTKNQDAYIYRYQKGSRSKSTLDRVYSRTKSMYNLSAFARNSLLSGTLPKVSSMCCVYTKEKPLNEELRRRERKPIVGVRRAESVLRKGLYHSCLDKMQTKFTPLYDFTDQVMDILYRYYDIEEPKLYTLYGLCRSGCAGCSYGRNIELELNLLTDAQRKYAIDSFHESYDLKGISYQYKQLNLFSLFKESEIVTFM